jgi:oxygen-dependent protoporphyrinogen oxidase
MASKHIIVVGAGIAGLTAAYRLQQAGHAVQVLEAASGVGGRMITIDWQGYNIDPGAEFVTGADSFLMEMVDSLGVREQLINYSDQQSGFYVTVMRDGKTHKVNFMSIPSYLGWTGVSLGARLSMLKLLPPMLRAARHDVYYPERFPGDDSTTMEEYFTRKINREMFDYWLEPTMDVFCHYQPSDLSGSMMLIQLGAYLSKKLYTFEGGIGFFPKALASHLDVTLRAEVQQIETRPDGSSVTVHYLREEQAMRAEADAVVLAVPGDAVLGLLSDPRPAWKTFFPTVRYSRVGIVYHLLEGDDPVLDEGGIMFPLVEPWKLCALGWKRRPDGRILAMSDLKASLYDPAISDADLIKAITQETIQVVPAFENHIVDQMVFRWPRKVPTFPPGQLTLIRQFKTNPQEGPLYFCGDYLVGLSTGAALASGWQAADRVLQKLS